MEGFVDLVIVLRSNVSLRDCALADDQTAGAATALLAASAVIDCKNSRRFMTTSRLHWEDHPQAACQNWPRCTNSVND
jgi:hypothetical protein